MDVESAVNSKLQKKNLQVQVEGMVALELPSYGAVKLDLVILITKFNISLVPLYLGKIYPSKTQTF